MNTVQVKLPRWMGVYEAPWPARVPAKSSAEAAVQSFRFNAEESARFLRIVSECGHIRRHYDLYRWLGGDVQQFLPHDIMLSAWGDFANWELKLDLTSSLAGVRTAGLAHCSVDSLLRRAHGRWLDAGRTPVLLKRGEIEPGQSCQCPIHAALANMESALVHGLHDKRSGRDSLFVALSAGALPKGRSLQRFLSSLDPLFAQIDAAFRKVPAFPLAPAGAAPRDGSNVLDLSARELEVLESICRGKTNLDIAAALDISPFTVKNHVQRIFRKIGVTNRTQAAARYAEAVRESARLVEQGAAQPNAA